MMSLSAADTSDLNPRAPVFVPRSTPSPVQCSREDDEAPQQWLANDSAFIIASHAQRFAASVAFGLAEQGMYIDREDSLREQLYHRMPPQPMSDTRLLNRH